jgi:hypothetical protein
MKPQAFETSKLEGSEWSASSPRVVLNQEIGPRYQLHCRNPNGREKSSPCQDPNPIVQPGRLSIQISAGYKISR